MNSATENLKKFESTLDDYLNRLQIAKIDASNVIDDALETLNLPSDVIRHLSADECAERAINLLKYKLEIQKDINRNKSRIIWAKSNLDNIVSRLADNYGNQYTKYEQKREMVIADDSYAEKLAHIILHAQSRLEETSQICYIIQSIANVLLDVQRTRRSENYEARK